MSTSKPVFAPIRWDSEPLLSVLLPVRNGERYMREALDSILRQTYGSFEVIAIDDGSEDGSAAVLREACKGDGRLHVLRTESVGTANALNAGVGVARGQVIARMDQDDIAHPDRFRQQMDWMRRYRLDVCGTFAKTFGEAHRLLDFPVTDEAIKLGLLVRATVLHPTAMIRTELLRSYPYAADSFLEDHELCVRVAPVARMGNVPRPLLQYRRHAEQTTQMRAAVICAYQHMLGMRRFRDLVPDATPDECKLFEELLEAAPSLQDPQRLRQAGEVVFRRIPAHSREAKRVRVRMWQRVPRLLSLGREALRVHWEFRMREPLLPDRTDVARALTALFPKRAVAHALPTFLVIGAARCGTTSLHEALAQHPDVFMAAKKELRFFAFDGAVPAWNGPSSRVFLKTSVVSLQEYMAQFRDGGSAIARGESSPLYLYADGTAERIHRLIPEVRLIVILRDPAERALSHFQHLRRLQLEPLPDFRAALAAEDKRLEDGWAPDYLYRRRGFYFEQLRRFYAVFAAEQISVHRYEDLVMHPHAEMRRICEHIGVRGMEDGQAFPHRNAGVITPAERENYGAVLQSLREGYRRDLQELGKLVGRDFTDWM